MKIFGGNGLDSLRKAFGLGSTQALIRIVCSLVSVKLTAVYLGPAGLAIVAQVNTLITLGQGSLGSGINTALVRLTAEYGDDAARRRALWGTAFRFASVLALLGCAILAVGAKPIARAMLGNADYSWAIVFSGAAVAASILNNVLLSAMNGVRDIVRVVKSNVFATIFGLIVFAPMSMIYGIDGGILGSVVAYFLGLLISIKLSVTSERVRLQEFLGRWDRAEFRRIASFYPMLIAHAALTPLAMLLVRNAVIDTVGVEAGGVWQAAWRLSEVYTGIITTSVSLYFMPRLGELINDSKALRLEIWRTFVVVSGATAALALVIYLLRDWVVYLVFTNAFNGVVDLMPVQLVGDVVKMMAWIFGFVLVALVRSWWYLAIAVVVPMVFVLGVWCLAPNWGAMGATWAYVASATLQLILGCFALRRIVFSVRMGDRDAKKS